MPVRAEAEAWHDMLSKLEKKVFALRDEEQSIGERIEILDEQSRVLEEHTNLLRERLAAMNGGGDVPPTPGNDPLADADAEGAEEAPRETGNHAQREDELISECAGRIAILQGKDGKTGTAFFVPQEGKSRIFASAPWVAGNGSFTLSDIYGNPIPFAQQYSAPVGFDLLGLHPVKEELPAFDVAANNEIPAVGARILVVVVDAQSKGLAGVGGAIRGIGPDTLEIDAELTPEMSGAPILALDSGKVIGIVAEQVSGVANDWALGTRHEGSRNFAVRLDRIKDWETGDFARFAKEAAYVTKIQDKVRIASIAHLLLESERWLTINPTSPRMQTLGSQMMQGETYEQYRERTKEMHENRRQASQGWANEHRRMTNQRQAASRDADKHASDPHIIRARAWIKELQVAGKLEPGGNLDRNLAFIYRTMLSDLTKREPDPSAHLGSYHRKQYRSVVANRDEGIKILTAEANRLGR
jgi:flagellin-specific chaperone FliS